MISSFAPALRIAVLAAAAVLHYALSLKSVTAEPAFYIAVVTVLLAYRPAWDLVVIVLSLAGLVISVSGVVIGWRRLVR